MAGFEELEVWKASMRLTVSIYAMFDESRDYGFRDQICRSSVSIPSNIAEGHDRGTDREFIRFLQIALGSAAELRTQLYLAARLQKADNAALRPLIGDVKHISAQLRKLIAFRQSKIILEAKR
jgi:four helix bundle protein